MSTDTMAGGIAGWLRISHISAGFIAVLVGYTSSVAIVFQAAAAAGARDAQLASWMWALGIGMGVTCIGLALAWRAPVLTAWSTPGAALLATSLGDIGLAQSIGAFLGCSVLITLCGVTGWFQKIMDCWPPSCWPGASCRATPFPWPWPPESPAPPCRAACPWRAWTGRPQSRSG